jgi:hypothetical protein
MLFHDMISFDVLQAVPAEGLFQHTAIPVEANLRQDCGARRIVSRSATVPD